MWKYFFCLCIYFFFEAKILMSPSKKLNPSLFFFNKLGFFLYIKNSKTNFFHQSVFPWQFVRGCAGWLANAPLRPWTKIIFALLLSGKSLNSLTLKQRLFPDSFMYGKNNFLTFKVKRCAYGKSSGTTQKRR